MSDKIYISSEVVWYEGGNMIYEIISIIVIGASFIVAGAYLLSFNKARF
jgi:hypothetical protein